MIHVVKSDRDGSDWGWKYEVEQSGVINYFVDDKEKVKFAEAHGFASHVVYTVSHYMRSLKFWKTIYQGNDMQVAKQIKAEQEDENDRTWEHEKDTVVLSSSLPILPVNQFIVDESANGIVIIRPGQEISDACLIFSNSDTEPDSRHLQHKVEYLLDQTTAKILHVYQGEKVLNMAAVLSIGDKIVERATGIAVSLERSRFGIIKERRWRYDNVYTHTWDGEELRTTKR
jgi:hypothetical protein